MPKTPGQFSLLGLFLLITASAALCAVLRIPFHAIAKIVIVYAAVLLYYEWAVAPRVKPPWKQIIPGIMAPLGQFAPLVWQFWSSPTPWHRGATNFLAIIFCIFVCSSAFSVWMKIRMDRRMELLKREYLKMAAAAPPRPAAASQTTTAADSRS